MIFIFDNFCFFVCDLINLGFGFIICNDNGMFIDFSDDFYIFLLNLVGLGLGSGYIVFVSGGMVSFLGGNYGSEIIFMFIGIGLFVGISIIVIDNDDFNCFMNIIINLFLFCLIVFFCDINYV